jgi:hypothetical protein
MDFSRASKVTYSPEAELVEKTNEQDRRKTRTSKQQHVTCPLFHVREWATESKQPP